MPSYLLRDIDEKLWRRVKARAASEGRTLRFVVDEMLAAYAAHGYDVLIKELREQTGPKAVK